ncbi:hypothetical protein ILUMI_03675 [Ignelater luminosus]|uniref:Uncharacterized protein n=1 Tax=Ignelater luminosus TaxID=2038154 RepID=A0A8K0DAJ6_IGNLU|nr:hypothetical protein ILUMI_03675 [Ignelater luminosus]
MATAARGGLVALFKRGWHEIPEVIGSSFMALIGLGLMGTGYTLYVIKDGDNRKHKMDYIVIRHDDPKAARVRKGIDG